MDLVLGVDLGTSYFKLGLFDPHGQLRGLGRVAVDPDVATNRSCELPVERFWSALRRGIADALEQTRAKPSDIRGVSYASQANSFLLLDKHDRPLTPLILWPDRRADPVDPVVFALWRRPDFLERTGFHVESPEFAIAKWMWFRTYQAEVWDRTQRVQTISDYLAWSLTAERVGDEATASLLGLWDLPSRDWWDEALDAAGVRRGQLSMPRPPGTIVGRLTPMGAQLIGLIPGIPFAVGSLDHHAAAIGAGMGRLAPVSESTGTVLAVLCFSDQYRPHEDYCTGPGADPTGRTRHYRLAFDSNGAGALDRYQREQAPNLSIDMLLDLARSVDRIPDDPFEHGARVRHILLKVAARLAELIAALRLECPVERIVATGGGARSDLWLQIKADMLDVDFIATQCPESACLGAAMYAARAAGWFSSLDEAGRAMVGVARTFSPTSAGRDALTRGA